MPSLRELQIRCRQAFVAGDPGSLADLLISSAGHVGIEVYQNNARETFRKALAASYPVIAALVGDACFASLAAKYLDEFPSRAPDLQAFGVRFPSFLDRCYSATSHRYLADVARLELAVEQVLLAPEMPPLGARALASLPASELPSLRLVRSPAARLLTSEFPILDIWRMHHRENAASVALDAGPSHVLVVRKTGDSVLRALSTEEFDVAVRLGNGESLGDAFAASKIAMDFQTVLANLLRYGLFSEISHNKGDFR